MSGVLVVGARVALTGGVVDGGWVLVEDGVIAGLGVGEPSTGVRSSVENDGVVLDGGGRWLLPGFVDVHVHGALGCETMDGDVGGLEQMAGFYAQHGVTGFLATTWTGSRDETFQALRGVGQGMRELDGTGARLLGAHMEGPYLNPLHCGAQDVGWIRPGDVEELNGFLDTGVVRLLTLAPEVEGNLDLVDLCVSRGITVSAGHTDATYGQMVEAVDRGVGHVTHTFNAMRPLHHREPGVVGAALTMPGLTVELIADGVHVHPVVMGSLVAARGVGGVVLVTDAMRATGLGPGEYAVGDRRAVLADDGAVRLAGDGALAGSVLTMDAGLRNVKAATGLGLGELWPAVSANAARVAGVADRTGSIAIGMAGDLVLMDDEVEVVWTMVGGELVYRRAEHADGDGIGSVSGRSSVVTVHGS